MTRRSNENDPCRLSGNEAPFSDESVLCVHRWSFCCGAIISHRSLQFCHLSCTKYHTLRVAVVCDLTRPRKTLRCAVKPTTNQQPCFSSHRVDDNLVWINLPPGDFAGGPQKQSSNAGIGCSRSIEGWPCWKTWKEGREVVNWRAALVTEADSSGRPWLWAGR